MELICKQAKRVQRLRWEQLESGIIIVMVWKKEITNLMTNLQKPKTKTLWVSVFFVCFSVKPSTEGDHTRTFHTSWGSFITSTSPRLNREIWSLLWVTDPRGLWEYLQGCEEEEELSYNLLTSLSRQPKSCSDSVCLGHCLGPLTRSLTTGPSYKNHPPDPNCTEQAVESIRRTGPGEFI